MSEIFYKVMVQAVLLFGLESWVMSSAIGLDSGGYTNMFPPTDLRETGAEKPRQDVGENGGG